MGSGRVARLWHGRVPTERAEVYLDLMRRVALRDYRATPGNRGAYTLARVDGDVTHVLILTLWESIDAIRAFAGDPAETAKYYDFDADYLLEFEPKATHYIVASGSGPGWW